MKKILITQQKIWHEKHQKHMDALDNAWCNLMLEIGLFPLVVANIDDPILMKRYMNELEYDGVVFTGGNDLSITGSSNAIIERDQFEQHLLSHAIAKKVPVLGVCRGMQLINCYFGGNLVPVVNQVSENQLIQLNDGETKMVNSYHQWGIDKHGLASCMQIWAKAGHVVKGIKHENKAITGMMWHPERPHHDKAFSLQIIMDVFQ